jgi:hypothetical protein
MLATGADFRYPETEGQRPSGGKLFNPYMDTLFKAGRDDVVLNRRIGEVLNMLKAPSAFFEPAIMARVAWWAFRRKLTGADNAAQPIPAMPPALIPVG